MNTLVSELVKVRAYRLTAWILPSVVVAMVGVAAFGLASAAEAFARGTSAPDLIEVVAFAPGSGTFVSGLLVGIFAMVVVTADETSGVINLSLMASRARDVLLAKLALGGLIALAVSVVGTVAVALAAVVLLPPELLSRTIVAPEVWVNVLGVATTHLAWAAMGSAAGLMLRRSALALGALMGLVLVPPVASASLRGAGLLRVAAAVDLLPPGLMQSATLTGADAVAAVTPVLASLGLLAWCVLFGALGGLGFRRSR